MAGRTLTEAEFEQVKADVLASAPPNLDEATFTRWVGPTLIAAVAEAETRPAPVAGSAIGRLASNFGAQVNPVSIVSGLYEAVKSPQALADTTATIARATREQLGQAATAAREGRYSEAAGHGFGAIPLIGPAAVAAGEQIGSGDIAGGVGTGLGLIAGTLAPGAVKPVLRALPIPGREALARGLQAGAEERVAGVMAPAGQSTVKVRMGNTAAEVAPTLLQEPGLTAAWSREGLHANIRAAFEDAKAGLDVAHDARLHARTFKTQPLVEALLEKRRLLTAEAPEATGISYQTITVGGKPVTTWIKNRGPLGENVVPGPNAARVAKLDQALAELRRLGPDASYEPLRRIRQAYDQEAQVIYSPAVTADFLTKRGTAQAAADISGTLRDFLAKQDPTTAAANARYSLMRSAETVLDATAELERVRPVVGRRIMTAFLGGMGGGQLAGVPGLVGGAILGPVVDAAVGAGLTTKLQTAQLMRDLATALRQNNPRAAASVGARLRARLPQLGVLVEQLRAGQPAVGPVPAGTQGETK